MQAEIQLHKMLGNGHSQHIVRFHRFFEDEKNVYIILELCSNQTLAELLRRRRTLTEFECRYYIRQVIEALKFMHSPENRVLHRDLKLGNLFLDSNLHIKIGDFGLATQLSSTVDLRASICGTPNYMAPEILVAQDLQGECGYSFAADIWALGIIMYTMLVGRPPFETSKVEETYTRIKDVAYTFPTAEQR